MGLKKTGISKYYKKDTRHAPASVGITQRDLAGQEASTRIILDKRRTEEKTRKKTGAALGHTGRFCPREGTWQEHFAYAKARRFLPRSLAT